MKAIIEPGRLSGSITAPASKSMTQRAYAAALLHTGITIIHNAGKSDDEQAALNIIHQLGAGSVPHPHSVPHLQGVAHLKETTEITSTGIHPTSTTIHCGESGLAARLFTPIAALSLLPIIVAGRGSLLRRPMEGLDTILQQLGVAMPGFTGYVPFTVQGPLQPRSIHIHAGDSSQFLSGLLFALSSCATMPVTLQVSGLKSTPYIGLTLEVLAHFGKPITHKSYREFYIDPALFTNKEVVEISIEGDWSSAAAMLVAGAIAGEVTVRDLNTRSSQADRAIISVLQSAGAGIAAEGSDITANRNGRLRCFDFDATHCPDLFPILAILAACCDEESSIRGIHRLFHKESNRVESVTEMLQAFAVPFSVEDDTLFITGVQELQGTVIDSYHDHRIVMAAAIGALRAGSRVDIFDAQCVDKSYPSFFNDLLLCGGNCKLTDSK